MKSETRVLPRDAEYSPKPNDRGLCLPGAGAARIVVEMLRRLPREREVGQEGREYDMLDE